MVIIVLFLSRHVDMEVDNYVTNTMALINVLFLFLAFENNKNIIMLVSWFFGLLGRLFVACSFVCSFVRSLVPLFVHSFHLLSRSLARLFVSLFVCL